MVALAIVISLRAVGNILVLAAGGLIVLVLTGAFVGCWPLAPATACSPAPAR